MRYSKGSRTAVFGIPKGPGGRRRWKCETVSGTKKEAEALLHRRLIELAEEERKRDHDEEDHEYMSE